MLLRVVINIKLEAPQAPAGPRRPAACSYCAVMTSCYKSRLKKTINGVRTVMLTQLVKEHNCRTAPMVAAARSSLKSAVRLLVAAAADGDVVVVDAAAVFFFVLVLSLLRDRSLWV